MQKAKYTHASKKLHDVRKDVNTKIIAENGSLANEEK